MSMTMSLVAMLAVCLVARASAADVKLQAWSTNTAKRDLEVFNKIDAKLAQLRGNVLSNWAQDAQEEVNDDDDDDDGDDDTHPEADDKEGDAQYSPAVIANASSQVEPELKVVAFHGLNAEPVPAVQKKEEDKKDEKEEDPHAAEKEEEAKEAQKQKEKEKEKEDKNEEALGALAAAKDKVKAAHSKIEAFDNDEAFEDKISKDVKEIANETQSPVMSEFLGELRLEMRSYAKPSYPAYLEARADAAEKRVKELEAELKDDPKNVSADVKRDGAIAKLSADAESVSAKDVERKAGETWAVSFFANIVLLSVVFAMASSKTSLVRNYTWVIIDQVIAIFLAVMYFQAFDSLLDYISLGTHNAVMASIIHAVVLLAMIIALAFYFRGNELSLVVLCGAGAHIASFSSIHAAVSLQNHWLGISYTSTMCIFGMLLLAAGLAIVLYLTHTAKRNAHGRLAVGPFNRHELDNDIFVDKTDELENDFCAMAFSVVFTMFVRFLITGHHPVDEATNAFDHTATQRTYMLIYACICLLIAGFAASFCSKKAAQSIDYTFKRAMGLFNTVASMNAAWAFLYWGEWEFFENLYAGEAIKGRVMFAIAATCACGLLLVALTKVPSSSTARVGQAVPKDRLVALTALGLVCAWSWELCFDAAVLDMTQGVEHPAKCKIGTTLLMFAIVLPVYALYVKPITSPVAEAIGA